MMRSLQYLLLCPILSAVQASTTAAWPRSVPLQDAKALSSVRSAKKRPPKYQRGKKKKALHKDKQGIHERNRAKVFLTIVWSTMIVCIALLARTYTYQISRPYGILYANEQGRRGRLGVAPFDAAQYPGLDGQALEKKKLLYTIDTNYILYNVLGNGDCVPYSLWTSMIHALTFSDETHNIFVKDVQRLEQMTRTSLQKLTDSPKKLYQDCRHNERTYRIKEAHEKLLAAIPPILALLDKLKTLKPWKARMALLNKVDRLFLGDFIRAGMIVVRFHKHSKKQVKDALFMYDGKHLLERSCWLDPTDCSVGTVLQFFNMDFPVHRNNTVWTSWEINDENDPTLSTAKIQHSKLVSVVFNMDNHYLNAVHPSLV